MPLAIMVYAIDYANEFATGNTIDDAIGNAICYAISFAICYAIA